MDADDGAAGDRAPDARIDAPEIGAAALDRLIFFSDAVFAIAMTLLVLAIPRPGANISRSLADDQGKFIAYFISFWVIALYWLAHHRLFRLVIRYDYGVLLLTSSCCSASRSCLIRARSSATTATRWPARCSTRRVSR